MNTAKKNTKWSKSLIFEAAANYTSRSAFAEGNKPAYEAARLAGLLSDLFPLLLNQWSETLIRREASKYRSRTEFANMSGAAYNAARRIGILGSLFDSKLESWSAEKIKTLARQCSSKKELKRLNASAYNAALRLGIIDELFHNQIRVNERDCVYLWSVNDEPGLYKFGITSYSMGDYRINQVAKEANVSPTIIILERVGYEAAKTLEQKMKRIGVPYRFSKKFYGHTEFRYMSPAQVGECVSMVKSIKTYRQSRNM